LDARSSPGFAIAGGVGQVIGATIAIGGGALIGAASGGNPLPFAAGVALAPHVGAYVRAWYEFGYTIVYDWLTDRKKESTESDDAGAGASGGLPFDVIRVFGPGRPNWVGPGERWTGPELRTQGPGGRGAGGGLAIPSFGVGSVGGCGLLGVEALAPLARR